jgi:hypothetical protein
MAPESRTWGERWGSNPRPPVPQTGALPTELRPPLSCFERVRSPLRAIRQRRCRLARSCLLAPRGGLEPPTKSLEGSCSIHLSYRGRISRRPHTESSQRLVPLVHCRRLPATRFGRGRGIRTPDILLPKQARYQTALYPGQSRSLRSETAQGTCGCSLSQGSETPRDRWSAPPTRKRLPAVALERPGLDHAGLTRLERVRWARDF